MEVISDLKFREIGRLTDLLTGLADDDVANDTIKAACLKGWFTPESELLFPFFYNWDSPKKLPHSGSLQIASD